MKKILPLTYEPKIDGVINGTIRQTIRKGWKYKVGDQIAFHGWEGAPYRSKWSFRTGYFTLKEVIDIVVEDSGIIKIATGHEWVLDRIARLDGIDPPTGEALRDVLLSMGCTGKVQILRW
jgi:hypothetical protein